jgi:hypothetical protein
MEPSGQPTPLDQKQAGLFPAINNLSHRAKVGANNFYWIAGLSVINSFISAFGGGVSFVIGLGLTQFVDALASVFSEEFPDNAVIFKVIGLVLSILVSGVIAIFGYFGGKAHRWAFIVGMVLYALDSLLMILIQDWIGFFFHLYFLYGLWNGLQALNQLQKITAAQPGAVLDFPKNIGAP